MKALPDKTQYECLVIDGECTVKHCFVCGHEKDTPCSICNDCLNLRTPIPELSWYDLFPHQVKERIRTV